MDEWTIGTSPHGAIFRGTTGFTRGAPV